MLSGFRRSPHSLIFGALFGAILVILALPAASDGPLEDDTNAPCLGNEDPFCPPSEDGGSGPNDASVCYNCAMGPGDTQFECKTGGSSSDECSIVYDNQGQRTCEYTGNDCF